MPSIAIVSVAIFCASDVLPSLHILAMSSTFCRAFQPASSTRTPASALIRSIHLSQSLAIGACWAIAPAESHTSETRARRGGQTCHVLTSSLFEIDRHGYPRRPWKQTDVPGDAARSAPAAVQREARLKVAS